MNDQKNITRRGEDYRVQFNRGGVQYRKQFKTLEEAQADRDRYSEEHPLQERPLPQFDPKEYKREYNQKPEVKARRKAYKSEKVPCPRCGCLITRKSLKNHIESLRPHSEQILKHKGLL